MRTLRDLLRAEIVKLATTRTAYGLLAGTVAVVALGTFSTITSTDAASLTGPLHRQTFFLLASINIGLFTLVVGIRSFTDEFRHGTIIPTVLVTSSRRQLVTAKALTAAAAAAVLAITAQAVMAGLALLLNAGKGGTLTVTGADASAMAGLVAAAAAWAAIGVGVGAIVRHQVAAIVGGLTWILVVENLGAGLLRDAGRYLPGQAAHALADATQAGQLLAIPTAALVLAGYLVAVWTGATATLARRDVT